MFTYNNSYKKLIVVVTAITSLTFIQCQQKQEEETNEITTTEETNIVQLTDAQLKHIPIELTKIKNQHIASLLRLNGKVDVPPQNFISISNPLGGYVKQTKLLPGMAVKKGEVLATMENPEYITLQQDYLIAKSKYTVAKQDYERQRDLNASQASSDKVMQAAQAEMTAQRISMRALAQQLELININPNTLNDASISKFVYLRSPINGYVSGVNVNVGKYVSPTEVLFELIDPTSIQLKLNVYEKDLSKLSIGADVRSYQTSNPAIRYNGKLNIIGNSLNEGGLTEVHVQFNEQYKDLRPGMYMQAEIETFATEVPALPTKSVVYFEGKNYVFTAEDSHTFTMVAVEVGEKEDGYITILNPEVLENKDIIAEGAYTLLMKLKNTEEEE